jgi:hypothetical protein
MTKKYDIVKKYKKNYKLTKGTGFKVSNEPITSGC